MLYIHKNIEDYKFSDFFHGQWFKGNINGFLTEGIVTIENDRVFLCQNVIQGDECSVKHDLKYSYTITHHCDKGIISLSSIGINVLDLELERKDDFGKFILISNLSEESIDFILSNYVEQFNFIGFSKEMDEIKIDDGMVFKINPAADLMTIGNALSNIQSRHKAFVVSIDHLIKE